jgi:hypothetical protein
MNVVSLCPLRVGSLAWQQSRGAWMLTVVCKATFELLPGESRLYHEQEYPNEDDNFWNDDRERSLHSPSDLAPFKPRADVLLVGNAYAPQGKPVRSLVSRLIVGEVDKAIEIYCDRSFGPDGVVREGARFTRMPLRYERAAGGADTANPVGIRMDGRPDVYGGVAVPNLQPPGVSIASRSDLIEAIGYGPIAPSWPGRRAKLGPHAQGWLDTGWQHEPLPPEVDPSYWCAAPRDQQLAALRDNERIVLENLHAAHPRLVTSLPGVRPRAFVDRSGQEVALAADTLWIDTDRAICTLTWRGRVPVDSPRQAGRVLVAMDTPGKRASWAEVERLANRSTDEDGTAMIELSSEDITVDPGPEFLKQPPASGLAALASLSAPQPIAAPAGTVPPAADRGPPSRRPRNTQMTSVGGQQVASALPFVSQGPPPAPHPPRPPGPSSDPRPPPLVADGTSAWVPPSAPQAPAPPPISPRTESPWAGGGTRMTDSDVSAASPLQTGLGALRSKFGPPTPSAPPPTPPTTPPPLMAAADGAAGAVAASNAAAAANAAWQPAAPVEAPAPATAPSARSRMGAMRDATELLWFDPESAPSIRQNERFRPIVDELEPKDQKAEFDGFDAEPPPETPEPVKAKKLVFAVLTRADATDAEGVGESIGDAITDDGTFVPPLVMIAGDLHFPFDELETLKATVTSVTPLVAGDKKLKETIETVNELLKTPWLERSTGVAENLTARVKEAFAQSATRVLPASYLDTHTERILMEQRSYQKRTVFGETWIRSLLSTGGGAPIPTYLPESLSKKLPMFQVFRTRLIAEVHVQQDQYESHPCALRVVALGRSIGAPGRRAGRA